MRTSASLLPVIILALSTLLGLVPGAAADAGPSAADQAFQSGFGDAFLDKYWSFNPDQAISNGYYKYASKLIVPDDASRKAELAQLARWQAQLHRIDPQKLSPAVRADWTLLDTAFARDAWSITDNKAWEWNPALYNVAEPFALLTSLQYAPLERRLRTLIERLQNVPSFYAAAKTNLRNPTREHAQLAIEQNLGTLKVFGPAMQELVAGSSLSASQKTLFTRRLEAARAAIKDYGDWLATLDLAAARPFRLGREQYERKFALTIQSGEAAQALYQRALQEKERLHTQMSMLADMLWAEYFPGTVAPAERLEKIGQLIAKMSEQHVAREHFVAEVNRQIPQLEQWVRDHRLLDLDPSKALKVRETPEYKRGIAGASVDAPGPYDPDAPTYYNVTPLDTFSPERAESYLREYNRWMLPILNIHEAVPGHYVQLVYANKSPSRIKNIFGNGAMIEGWAVYAERAMLESGFGDHSAQTWLIYSKWHLRSVVNVILDYAVHVLDMSQQDAMQLLMREAFQSQEEAVGKWRRVQLSSVQLTSYYSGYSAIYKLRERLKRERGGKFDLKAFHEQFLSYGNAPVALIEQLMTSP